MFNIHLKKLLIIGSVLVISLVLGQKYGEECRVKRGSRQGVCVYITDCPHVLYEFTTGLSITQCGSENDKKVVCCANPKIRPISGSSPTSSTITTPSTTTTPRPPKRTHEFKCLEYQEAVKQETIVSSTFAIDDTKYDKCLHEKVPLIIGGENATAGEFPHMARLGYKGPKGRIIWGCGGSLISDKFILTAGHCLESVDYGNVTIARLGDLDFSTELDKVKHEDFDIVLLIPEPHYDFDSKYNDIALLKLNRTVSFSPYIRPACLPSMDFLDLNVTRFMASGWGLTMFTGNDSSLLQKVVLDYFSYERCLVSYSAGSLDLNNGVDFFSQFCAGSDDEEKDACQGDSGGPMQDYHDFLFCMYTLYGVTSFGQACATKGVPGVYTNILHYVDWIESIVWPEAALDVRTL